MLLWNIDIKMEIIGHRYVCTTKESNAPLLTYFINITIVHNQPCSTIPELAYGANY